jgi:hypothetical protein
MSVRHLVRLSSQCTAYYSVYSPNKPPDGRTNAAKIPNILASSPFCKSTTSSIFYISLVSTNATWKVVSRTVKVHLLLLYFYLKNYYLSFCLFYMTIGIKNNYRSTENVVRYWLNLYLPLWYWNSKIRITVKLQAALAAGGFAFCRYDC